MPTDDEIIETARAAIDLCPDCDGMGEVNAPLVGRQRRARKQPCPRCHGLGIILDDFEAAVRKAAVIAQDARMEALRAGLFVAAARLSGLTIANTVIDDTNLLRWADEARVLAEQGD